MGLSVAEISRLGADVQRQIREQLAAQARKKNTARAQLEGRAKPSKMHNVKTTRVMPNGKLRTFDSQKEARRYDELAQLLRAGKIFDLKLQPRFTLVEAFVTAEGDAVRALTYTADFSYCRMTERCETKEDGTIVASALVEKIVEDAKGYRQRGYIDKKKMVREKFGIVIREV